MQLVLDSSIVADVLIPWTEVAWIGGHWWWNYKSFTWWKSKLEI